MAPAGLEGSPEVGGGQLQLTVGTRPLVAEALGNIQQRELSWEPLFWHQDLAPPISFFYHNDYIYESF